MLCIEDNSKLLTHAVIVIHTSIAENKNWSYIIIWLINVIIVAGTCDTHTVVRERQVGISYVCITTCFAKNRSIAKISKKINHVCIALIRRTFKTARWFNYFERKFVLFCAQLAFSRNVVEIRRNMTSMMDKNKPKAS